MNQSHHAHPAAGLARWSTGLFHCMDDPGNCKWPLSVFPLLLSFRVPVESYQILAASNGLPPMAAELSLFMAFVKVSSRACAPASRSGRSLTSWTEEPAVSPPPFLHQLLLLPLARSIHQLDSSRMLGAACAGSGAAYAAICATTGMGCLYSCVYRTKMRAHYDLDEGECPDFLVHWCCECCALCRSTGSSRTGDSTWASAGTPT
ncbi:Protein PLANT CADMIUM RESISTANCE 3 [Hordeum vulgare]|nr:Protein PLANT CADMIUM RESISTANCE 3 [Hordeum vulgare]